jgi:hypothetical protein
MNNEINNLITDITNCILEDKHNNPSQFLVDIIDIQKKKEEKTNVWDNSIYKYITTLEINNIGNVGEMLIQKICKECKIYSSIDGLKSKKIGGGNGDGIIKNKTVEIKTARIGSLSQTFQHELGEKPWKSEYMIFIDIGPNDVYVTIFKNFSEEQYKEYEFKCNPYFPTKTITRRKKVGNFKLDTSVKINNICIKNGYSIIITNNNLNEIGLFIDKTII